MTSEEQRPIELSELALREARRVFIGKLHRRSFPRQFTANEAEDAFAQAELELSVVLARGEQIYNPGGWLVHCAWNRALSRVESGKRFQAVSMPAEELERLQDERPGVVEEVFQAEETAEVRRALQTLTEQEQTVVRLIFYEDLSLRGAAKRLGWSPSQVQRRKESSQRKLGKLISRE